MQYQQPVEAQSTTKSLYYSTLTYLCGNWDYINVGEIKEKQWQAFIFYFFCRRVLNQT